jgi:hypothetical protein
VARKKLDLKWQVQNFRLTSFPQPGSDVGSLSWKDITDAESELDETRPREAVRRQSGKYQNGALELTKSAMRIDLIYHPKPIEALPSPEALIIGSLEDEAAIFSEAAIRFLQAINFPIQRLALGATLLAPCNSIGEAYKALAKYLRSVKIKPQEMWDVLFRVNWRVPKPIASLSFMNRLVSWSAVQVTITAGPPQPGSKAQPLTSKAYVQLELDINTPAEQELISNKVLVPIYRLMMELASENAREGEIVSPRR